MQFNHNSDYPQPTLPPPSTAEEEARTPVPFPPAEIDPCARITTRVVHPARMPPNNVATVQHVLVRTMPPGGMMVAGGEVGGGGGAGVAGEAKAGGGGGDSVGTFTDSSDDSDSDSEMEVDGVASPAGRGPWPAPPSAVGSSTERGAGGGGSEPSQPSPPPPPPPGAEDRAYWLQRTLREAIYGRVKYAVVLRKIRPPMQTPQGPVEWEVTDERCAVKEMSWQHIRQERERLAEDPIKEVSSMQFLQRWLDAANARRERRVDMMDSHIMMPMDLVSDDRYLYSVMPYCDGGELFDVLEERNQFSEPEARYWMRQILTGLESLKQAGITHRDVSLENLLVHRGRCLVIDMGMCLRIPYVEEEGERKMSIGMDLAQGPQDAAGGGDAGGQHLQNVSQRRRYLILPQGTCGKWHYMSPEIRRNRIPFDGLAVDVWATGVILFLMLTGFPPWERPEPADERFRYMTAGYLVQMLTEWNLGLSADAMDLLQRMFWLDPRDRLSLEQVRAHPWMVNGPVQPPP